MGRVLFMVVRPSYFWARSGMDQLGMCDTTVSVSKIRHRHRILMVSVSVLTPKIRAVSRKNAKKPPQPGKICFNSRQKCNTSRFSKFAPQCLCRHQSSGVGVDTTKGRCHTSLEMAYIYPYAINILNILYCASSWKCCIILQVELTKPWNMLYCASTLKLSYNCNLH